MIKSFFKKDRNRDTTGEKAVFFLWLLSCQSIKLKFFSKTYFLSSL